MAYTDPSTLTWQTEEKPTSAKMNQATNDQFLALFPNGVAGASWTPTLEGDSSNASASVTGRKYQVGALMFVWARFVLTDPGSGIYFVTLPAAASGITASAANGGGQAIGGFVGRRVTPLIIVEGEVVLATATTVRFNASTTTGQSSRLESSVPWPWAADDILSFHAVYPVA